MKVCFILLTCWSGSYPQNIRKETCAVNTRVIERIEANRAMNGTKYDELSDVMARRFYLHVLESPAEVVRRINTCKAGK